MQHHSKDDQHRHAARTWQHMRLSSASVSCMCAAAAVTPTTEGPRQTGHSCIRAEQSPHALRWPQGTAACDLGLTKQMMHVVWPPMVDSGGTSGRPVSNCASASDVTVVCGGGGGLSSAEATAATGAATPALDEPAGTCKLAWLSR
eukprot:scaffold85590_cov62-Phaeocystis_antarctica.AAC.2